MEQDQPAALVPVEGRDRDRGRELSEADGPEEDPALHLLFPGRHQPRRTEREGKIDRHSEVKQCSA